MSVNLKLALIMLVVLVPSLGIHEYSHAWAALRPGGAYYSEWNAPHLGRLANLHLGDNAIGNTGAAALAAWPAPGNLATLDLAHNRIEAPLRARWLAPG